ncbi:hypothetical protein PYW07_010942 [Mythimna separata]|uniref:Nose resistant-to-fluoxetine protein N-terminal domain-containing protein n=1 Tax=Mythimna separata TaxID=271217 RepID=A0AAD7Y827_MYTSE|nr:hypothetical protein PYW07_010942 [Mythimna separata]
MKILYVLLLRLTSFCLSQAISSKDITIVDIVITGLKEQSWGDDERPCLDQTLTVLNNVRNYTVWAVWIWNSMHHPVGTFYGSKYSLGNYDQCLNAPSKAADPKIVTQYCLAEVTLTGKKFEDKDRNVLGATGPYVTTKTPVGRNQNVLFWGTCLPSTCKAGSIVKILKTIYLANPITPSEPEITVESCDIAGQKTEYSFGFYAFICLITTLLVLPIISTVYLQHAKTKSGAIHDIAYSFSLPRNWTSLTKKSDEAIGIIDLLRVLSAFVAVITHTICFVITGPISNGVSVDEVYMETKTPLLNVFKHIDLVVDIFFVISGLLLAKGLMEKKKKPMVALINRYFRLTASFAVILFYVVSVSMYTGDGPVWQKLAGKEQKASAESWWLALLMLNNYINSDNICLLVSWYIPCDYQLAVMGTILYVIWQKNKTMGKIVTTVTGISALLLPGLITYWKKLPGLLLFHDLENALSFRENEVYLDTYIRSHNRASPYLIGMAMGFIMSIYKPDNYRNVIAKKKLVLMSSFAIIAIYNIFTAPMSWDSMEYDHLSSALHAVTRRNLMALSVCIIIAIVEYGDIAFIRKSEMWLIIPILSRLSYGIYLSHSLIAFQNLYSRRNIQQFNLVYAETIYGFGVIVMSIILSTVLWMFVEAPVTNIVNLVTNPRSQVSMKNQGIKNEPISNGFAKNPRTKEEVIGNGFAKDSSKVKKS